MVKKRLKLMMVRAIKSNDNTKALKEAQPKAVRLYPGGGALGVAEAEERGENM